TYTASFTLPSRHSDPVWHYCPFFHWSADHPDLHSFPTRRSSDLPGHRADDHRRAPRRAHGRRRLGDLLPGRLAGRRRRSPSRRRSEEHTSELQSRGHLVCRLLLEKKKFNVCQINEVKKQTGRYLT